MVDVLQIARLPDRFGVLAFRRVGFGPNAPAAVGQSHAAEWQHSDHRDDVVPRPANDNFTNAFKIAPEGAVIPATNNYASLEPGEPLHAQVATVAASVWWTWSPAVNTNVLMDLAGSSFDPVLAVYFGTKVTNLQPVAAFSNDVVNLVQ